MEFDSCISGIDDSSCCDSDVDTDHAWLRRYIFYSIVAAVQQATGAKAPRDWRIVETVGL